MKAITARDREAGAGGLALTELPRPQPGQNDVIVQVHAAGFTPGELEWPTTWVDRCGHDRTPTVPGHELSGVVVELGYGTTGLTVGQRVFGLIDWARNGSLAEYTAMAARDLAPLPADVDHLVAAALPISGLTAWQALIDHAQLRTGQTVLIHGVARSSRSPARLLCDPRTGAPLSSSSKLTAHGSRTWPSESGTVGSSRSSRRYARSLRRLLRSRRTAALTGRRSSRSSKAASRPRASRYRSALQADLYRLVRVAAVPPSG